VPRHSWVPDALARGNTLRGRSCVHWVNDPLGWPARQENAHVLGHEQSGIPPEALDLLHEVVEIPMIGAGASLNVAVAGSLVLYKPAGMA
jgi:tRNA (guanosine-2'-O-)-methyltransferase